MCGIWASIGIATKNAELGIAAVASRGPDSGQLTQKPTEAGILCLAHRRLAIYDLSQSAAQPMARGPLSLVFNGALYNFHEIRAELILLGHKFITESDTEVLLAAWNEWGPWALSKFDGMFALVLWDEKNKRLYAARDRFGEKPLHLIKTNEYIAFASEIGQFFSSGLIKNPKINADVAKNFLDLAIAESGEKTFFELINRVPPNQIQTYEIGDDSVKLVGKSAIYGDLQSIKPIEKDFAKASQGIRKSLEKSVKNRLAADVKVGACLSGGLDSSAIVRIAAKLIPRDEKIECICAVFDERDIEGNDLSERLFALAAAEYPNINLHFVSFDDAKVVNTIEEILRRQGEPFAHSSIVAQYMVFEKAKELGIKVMLDGQGADELLGGYSGMIGHYLADVLRNQGLAKCRQEIDLLCQSPSDFNPKNLKLAVFNALISEKLRRFIAKIRGRWPSDRQITKGEMALSARKYNGFSYFEGLMLNLLEHQSLPSLLRYEDRNSMSFGIETRLPFLSNDVVQAALSASGNLKVRAGLTKAILRDAIKDIVPELIVNRRKKLGFITPQDKWLDGELKNWALEGVEIAKISAAGILELGKVENIVAKIGTSSEINNIIFRLACFGHFMRQTDGVL